MATQYQPLGSEERARLDAADLRRLGVTRARVDRATACHYRKSGRIVLVADAEDFEAAEAALAALKIKVMGDDGDRQR